MSNELTECINTALEFVRRAELYLDTFAASVVPKTGMVAFISDIRAALEGKDEFSLDRVTRDWERRIEIEHRAHVPMSPVVRFVLSQDSEQGDSDPPQQNG